MELLKRLTECNSPSGREDNIRALITEEIKEYCDELHTDTLGNLVARVGSGNKRIAVCAHMDEVGIVVTYKDDKGFLRFAPIGGLDKKSLVGRRVVFCSGAVGIIGTEAKNNKSEISKMYIDIGGKSDITTGDMACFEGTYHETEEIVISKALDNRVGCYALIKALKALKNPPCEVYFIFTVQEEVGLRGAKVACFDMDIDYAIAVDVTDTGDTPECEPMATILGGGAAVKIMDRSVICHSEVRSALIDAAKAAKIPYQLEIMTEGGTDAGAIHTSGSGIKTGGISIPTRYIHSVSEMANKSDIEAASSLLLAYIKSI